MVAASLAPIGWQFVDTPMLRAWVWDTPHFVARITTNDHIFEWIVEDRVGADDPANPRFLAEGMATVFAEAERFVRETIGKSYPERLGYRPYAGHLAYTFTIAGGMSVDFSGMDGTRCRVTVRNPDGRERTYTGVLRVQHYVIEVDQGLAGPKLQIQPSHITNVTPESGSAAGMRESTWLGVGRTHRGTVVTGCSGVVGYLPNTVDHFGANCAIHELDR